MATGRAPSPKIECRPLTPARWADLVKLFGANGACAGCWCMFFRQTGREFGSSHGAINRRAFRSVVASGRPTGVIATVNGEPAGWCAVAPREHYGRLERSKILAPVDDRVVWAATCFFVKAPYRRMGLNVLLLCGAVQYAAKRGARVIEGYPLDTGGRRISTTFAYHGLVSTFRAVGFREVARRSKTRPIMRLEVGHKAGAQPGAAPRRVTRG